MNNPRSTLLSRVLPTRVLVTGSNGLVGRAVVQAFRSSGAEVCEVVRKKNGTSTSSLEIDLATSGRDLSRLVRNPPMVVVHCAAAVPHWERYPDNEDTASATRKMDNAVIQAAECWEALLVYISSCGLYDPRDPSWKTEKSPLMPRSPYFSAKLHGESAVQKYSGIILRISAPYGPGMSPMLVLSRFIKRALAGSPLQIWGKGSREQDFIAAKDVAQAVLAAARVQEPGVFNVAAGIPLTMTGLAGEVIRGLGTGTTEFTGQVDPQEGWTTRYSVVKAKERLSWSSTSDLVFGIQELASESTQ